MGLGTSRASGLAHLVWACTTRHNIHMHVAPTVCVCVGGGCEAGVRVLVELQCPQDVRATAGVAYVAKCGTFPKI